MNGTNVFIIDKFFRNFKDVLIIFIGAGQRHVHVKALSIKGVDAEKVNGGGLDGAGNHGFSCQVLSISFLLECSEFFENEGLQMGLVGLE